MCNFLDFFSGMFDNAFSVLKSGHYKIWLVTNSPTTLL